MSFNPSYRPKLVESKISRYYSDKLKQKELSKQEIEIKLKEQKEALEIANTSPIKLLFKDFINFIKENYGFFLLITLLVILLWIRYIETNRKKEQFRALQMQHAEENRKIQQDSEYYN